MTVIQAGVLGLVQGLGEFLPISSSGHLILVPWLFNFPDQGLAFDIALHMGTLVAVVAYFAKDIWLLLISGWRSLWPQTRNFKDVNQKLFWLLGIATIPAAVFGYFLESIVESSFRHPLLVAVDLAVVGVVLFLIDHYAKQNRALDKASVRDAAIIGGSQVLALVPGVSRSGATIIAGRSLGLTRSAAARFSFLLSIPVIAGAGLLKLPNLLEAGMTLTLAVGFIVSAVSGLLAITVLLRYISNHSFQVFMWYRLAVALLVLIIYFVRG